MKNATKNALANSLKSLLNKKPLDKITITDITNDCGVNRMTFYYHFQDIYDLVEWICVNDAERAIEGKSTADNWQEDFRSLLELMLENKTFVKNVFHSVSRDYLEQYVYRLTSALFMDVIDDLSKGLSINDEDKRFIASFYEFAFLGIVLNWIDHNMKENPDEIIKRLSLLLDGNLESAVKRFAKQNTAND